jgi:hypothetical protein
MFSKYNLQGLENVVIHTALRYRYSCVQNKKGEAPEGEITLVKHNFTIRINGNVRSATRSTGIFLSVLKLCCAVQCVHFFHINNIYVISI